MQRQGHLPLSFGSVGKLNRAARLPPVRPAPLLRLPVSLLPFFLPSLCSQWHDCARHYVKSMACIFSLLCPHHSGRAVLFIFRWEVSERVGHGVSCGCELFQTVYGKGGWSDKRRTVPALQALPVVEEQGTGCPPFFIDARGNSHGKQSLGSQNPAGSVYVHFQNSPPPSLTLSSLCPCSSLYLICFFSTCPLFFPLLANLYSSFKAQHLCPASPSTLLLQETRVHVLVTGTVCIFQWCSWSPCILHFGSRDQVTTHSLLHDL